MIPDALLGLWERESVTLEGAPGLPEGPFEAARVRWFQARSYYADLRIPHGAAAPFAEEEAFGGRQRFRAPRLRFLHELDRSGRLGDDEGELAWDGAALLESGSFEFAGRACRYRERWVRRSRPDPALTVHTLHAEDGALAGLCVQVDDARLLLRSVNGFVAAREERFGPTGPETVAALDDAGPGPEDRTAEWQCVEGVPGVLATPVHGRP
ncbi:MAG: hypothetical protein V2J02_09015 [Pseudomonadales bacterium]|nr:hypothetical protein [Pseudomonadales bacterium]